MAGTNLPQVFKGLDRFFDDVFVDSAIESFRDQMNSMFCELGSYSLVGSYPKMNVVETEKEIVVEAACPGMKKEDIELEIKDKTLTISGKSVNAEEVKGASYISREIKKSAFRRTVCGISEDRFNLDGIKAKMEDGILTISVPKIEVLNVKPEPKKVEIQ